MINDKVITTKVLKTFQLDIAFLFACFGLSISKPENGCFEFLTVEVFIKDYFSFRNWKNAKRKKSITNWFREF